MERDSNFYLESASYSGHQSDIDALKALKDYSPAELSRAGWPQEQMYLVIRSLKHNMQKVDYEIQERDIIKIGRVKFAVKEIFYGDEDKALRA